MGGDRLVVDAGLLVDLALPVVELLLQLRLVCLFVFVPRLAQLVVDSVLLGLVEAEVEFRLRLLHATVVLPLDRCLVLAALLGIPADGVGGCFQVGARRVELLLRLRRLQPLLRLLPVRLEMRLLQLEEFALVVLPRSPRDHLVVDGPDAAQGEEHGEADEGPLQALQLERLSRHRYTSATPGVRRIRWGFEGGASPLRGGAAGAGSKSGHGMVARAHSRAIH